MAATLLILFVFTAGAAASLVTAAWWAKRQPSPVKALPPAERRYYGIAQDASRLLERILDDDSDLPVFRRDDDRQRAHNIIRSFYKR